jgi:hypothetical protein
MPFLTMTRLPEPRLMVVGSRLNGIREEFFGFMKVHTIPHDFLLGRMLSEMLILDVVRGLSVVRRERACSGLWICSKRQPQMARTMSGYFLAKSVSFFRSS